ncbi:hypothetical protein INR49_028026, partial [Caranx melampygus]
IHRTQGSLFLRPFVESAADLQIVAEMQASVASTDRLEIEPNSLRRGSVFIALLILNLWAPHSQTNVSTDEKQIVRLGMIRKRTSIMRRQEWQNAAHALNADPAVVLGEVTYGKGEQRPLGLRQQWQQFEQMMFLQLSSAKHTAQLASNRKSRHKQTEMPNVGESSGKIFPSNDVLHLSKF